MGTFVYRLQLLLEQKEESKKEAERELTQQERELANQQAKHQALEIRAADLATRREQLRRDMLTKSEEGRSLVAEEVLRRSEFVKVVGVQIEEAKRDVQLQRVVIQQYESRVRACRSRLEEAQREVEILNKHRFKQQDRFLRDLQAKEDLNLDEIGNVLYSTRSRTQ